MKPVIGLPARGMENRAKYYTKLQYCSAVEHFGALPVLIPEELPENAADYVSLLDGLLVTGGWDINPLLYAQEPCPKVTLTCQREDELELAMIREAVRLGKPVFGICRGIQSINVALGGTLWQDIPSQFGDRICHYQSQEIRSELTHTVSIEPDSVLAAILGVQALRTNSFHHQAVREVAPGLLVCARAADGLIEAVENADGSVLGVQWHPEDLYMRCPDHAKLFEAFVERCREKRG